VGLNLTAASHVILLEPCLNPALEAQAIGRVHRLGQTKPTTVKRLIVANSVEARMVEVVKKRVAGRATGEEKPAAIDPHAAEPTIAGGLQTDSVSLGATELAQLFGVPY
jgi:superfamily II DNA or RNA helicase